MLEKENSEVELIVNLKRDGLHESVDVQDTLYEWCSHKHIRLEEQLMIVLM